jgi:hypothetical protein
MKIIIYDLNLKSMLIYKLYILLLLPRLILLLDDDNESRYNLKKFKSYVYSLKLIIIVIEPKNQM